MAQVSRSRKSAEMARVRTRDTAPELAVRSVLHHAGFRFRLHERNLPGTPDIVLPRHRLAIFVHGCFWHGHECCPRAALPKTRPEFWRHKIARNAERDQAAEGDLRALGWRTLTIWSCEVGSGQAVAARLGESLDMAGRPIREASPRRVRRADRAARAGIGSSRRRLA